jgi:predicted cupin superfamily sugar epimerase
MDPRAARLIADLALAPHPEGGYYRQIYKSASTVAPIDDRSVRTALTTIYFLLPAGEVSRWHRVRSDEVWHYYEGAPLELLTADPGFKQVERHRIGLPGDASQPVHVVVAHDWQAAQSTGTYTLVGCTVGPGFEFDDFTMLAERPDDAERVRRDHPDIEQFI